MNTQTRTALMHQQDQPEDCVNAAAKELGMQIRWQGEGVEEKGYLPSPASGGGAGGEGTPVSCPQALFRPAFYVFPAGTPGTKKEVSVCNALPWPL